MAIPLLKPTDEGLPTNVEAAKLDALEDGIAGALSQNEHGVFAAAITTNGMRELVFYVSEWKPEHFEQKVEVASRNTEYKPQFLMQEDKNWSTFANIKGLSS